MFHTTRLPPLAMGCACMHGSHPSRSKLGLNGRLAFVLHDLGPTEDGRRRCMVRVVHEGATVAELPVVMRHPESLSETDAVKVLDVMSGRRRRRKRRRQRRRNRRQAIGNVAGRAGDLARGVADAFGGGGRQQAADDEYEELPEDFFEAPLPERTGNSTLVIGGLAAAAVAALALSS